MAWLHKHVTKTGRVIFHVRWRDAEGHTRGRSTKSGNPETAELMRAQVEAQQGPLTAAAEQGPEAALRAFLRSMSLTKAEETVGMYRRHLRPLLDAWKDVPMQDWSRRMAEDYLHEKRDQRPRPWSPTAVRIWIHACRAFVKWTRDAGVACPDFVSGIPNPRKETKIPKHLKIPDLGKLLDAARGHRLEVAVGLAGLAGMRRSEFRVAQVRDVDFDRDEIRIRGVKRGRERLVTLEPALREILERRAPEVGALVRHGYAPQAEYKGLRTLCEAAGVPYVTFHQLRHTYATAVLKSGGASLAEVKDLLGHRNISTTSLYLHSDDDGRKAAVLAFGKALQAAR